ncbi:hypothetical protein BAE44_0001915 [Dichanthelium oligosanthes]|uniref:Uncharacterized protein n=1 Tax=Dichanthelium oligosanthes TaxID=888268 RepID=A0A1E5WI45_9POAL|nr:hypothetical protein BAE44_0001915 [Dichanthelium oligosanthes]
MRACGTELAGATMWAVIEWGVDSTGREWVLEDARMASLNCDTEGARRGKAAAPKAENCHLAEAEAAAIAASALAPSKAAVHKASRVAALPPNVTEAELARLREEEALCLEREAEAAKKHAARMAKEEEYERVVLVANTNRDDSIIEARSVEEATARMAVVDLQAALPAESAGEGAGGWRRGPAGRTGAKNSRLLSIRKIFWLVRPAGAERVMSRRYFPRAHVPPRTEQTAPMGPGNKARRAICVGGKDPESYRRVADGR